MQHFVGGREHDIENIQKAHDLAGEIADWFRDTPDWEQFFRFVLAYEGWAIDLQRIGIPDLRGLFLILVKKDNLYFRGSGFGFSGDHPVIVLKVLDKRGIMNPHVGNWLAVGHRRELEHELVHYLDYLRGAPRGIASAEDTLEEGGWEAYANHPTELNARWQEASTSLVRLLTHPKPHIQERAKEVFLNDYSVFQNALWKGFAPDYFELLTQPSLQRLEKRTWQLFQNLQEA